MYRKLIDMDKTIIKDKWIRIIGVPTIVVLLILMDDTGPDHISTEMLLFKLFRNAFFVLCYWESNRMLFTYMRNRYPDLRDTSKRILHHLLLFIVYMLFAGLIFTMINVRLPQNSHEDFWSEYLEILRKSAVLLGVVTVIYECVYYFGLYEKSQLESERLKKEALISQVELLRSQISPHFLFNSLNALITMVPEDPQLSVLFIQKLSNVYRHVLSYNGRDVIDLQTEKNFLDDYIFLHQIRFHSNLIVKFQLPDKLDHLSLIPFTLQMLVENAIKHNIISTRKPLTIQIAVNKNFIVVSNNLQKKTSGVESTNTGLKNIINRYELLNGKQVDVTVTPTEFRVSLPLIVSNEGL
ncbi:signal transduction histidine kinase, LytS [Chitinophaga pinensis DSM 2588]|uniref:Signal transduction histidine kinase, LytS n=2 Tax=Chitinophaga pinensis TaxID=79329 RepID=A0A979GM41_CHIPD|nr:signal transduction histidine kinase, LytS [Chitinophaga pinensis DSM 2588]